MQTFSKSSIIDALKQAIKYTQSPPTGTQLPDTPQWQTSTKLQYPHEYGNSDGLTFTSQCMNSGSDFTNLLEFPILQSGEILARGPSNAGRMVGPSRVIFKVPRSDTASIGSSGWNWIYCGVMTHFGSAQTVNGPALKPFQLCT